MGCPICPLPSYDRNVLKLPAASVGPADFEQDDGTKC